jgi:hypothetical protein
MNREVVKTRCLIKNHIRGCKVVHPVIVTQHFVERVVERNICPLKLSHLLNFAIPRYSFSLIYDKTFSFKYKNEFIVVGEFKEDKYVLKTVLSSHMKPETCFNKTLKPM